MAIIATDATAATYHYTSDGYTDNGVVADNPFAETNPLGFTGNYHNYYFGLVHLGRRWYDSIVQQTFLQQDDLNIIGDPTRGNRYAYAGDDPVNNIDPTGRKFWANFVGALSGGLAGWSCTVILAEITDGVGVVGAAACFTYGAPVDAAVTSGMESDGTRGLETTKSS